MNMCRRLSIYLLIILLFHISGCQNGHSGDSDGGGLDASSDGKIEIDGGSDTDSDSDSDSDGDTDSGSDGNIDDSGVDSHISTWMYTLGDSGEDYLYSVIETPNNEYIFTGTRYSANSGESVIWVVQTDQDGNIVQDYSLGNTAMNVGKSLAIGADSDFAIAGYTYSDNFYLADIILLKIDTNHDLLWGKTIGGDLGEHVREILSLGSEGFQILGTTESFISSGACSDPDWCDDIWLVTVDLDGSITDERSIGGPEFEEVTAAITTDDYGRLFVGYTGSFGFGGGCWPSECYDIWVIKTSESGIIEWQKTIGIELSDFAHSVIQSDDGGYILVGQISHYIPGEGDFWIIKLTSDGNIEWQKTIGGDDYDIAYSIISTFDGGFIVGGDSRSFSPWGRDIWLIKFDSDGSLLWQKAIGGYGDERLYKIIETTDHGILLVGNSDSFGLPSTDALLLKLNAFGELNNQCDYIKSTDKDTVNQNVIELDSYSDFIVTDVSEKDIDLLKSINDDNRFNHCIK